MHDYWLLFAQVFTVVAVAVSLLYLTPLPFFDRNSATVICSSHEAHSATARALSIAIGKPRVELNTHQLLRLLYKDGTSVDSLIQAPTFSPMYKIVALKSIVLSLFSGTPPRKVADAIADSLRDEGYDVQLISQPDVAFPDGATVIVLSEAFRTAEHAGFGIIVRRHAFRIGGQRPARFKGWRTEAKAGMTKTSKSRFD